MNVFNIVKFVLLVGLFINIFIVAGCVTKKTEVNTVQPKIITQKIDYGLNEPASDGNFRVSIMRYYETTKDVTKTVHVTARLENLRSDKTIHFLASDFQLFDINGNMVSPGYQINNWDSYYDLWSNDRKEIDIDFFVYPEIIPKRIKFDFNGPSGKIGSPIVFFNL